MSSLMSGLERHTGPRCVSVLIPMVPHSCTTLLLMSLVEKILSKMDGLVNLQNVLVVGMTNRMELLDEALLRPGRFEVSCIYETR